jgi:hypothetical protein
MPAAKLNLPVIEKGATYRHTLYWKDSSNVAINLQGCTAKMQVRESKSAATVLLELSTQNAGLVITAATGKIDIYISDENTATLPASGGVYDLEIYHGNGDTTRLCEGTLEFSDQVTR